MKVLIDPYADSKDSRFFNQRARDMDRVVRKIDKLPKRIENALANMLEVQVSMKVEEDKLRSAIKSEMDFSVVHLFRQLAF